MTEEKAVEPVVDEVKKQYLSLDDMISASDVEYRDILAWDGKYVRIGSLTAEQVAEWRDTVDGPAKKSAGVRLFVDSLVDETGKRIGGPMHYNAFRKKGNKIIERVINEIIDLNGMSAKKDAEAKNV